MQGFNVPTGSWPRVHVQAKPDGFREEAMRSRLTFCGGDSAVLLSDALSDYGGRWPTGAAPRNGKMRTVAWGIAAVALFAVLLAPLTAQQMPGGYGAPYASPYGGAYGNAPQPYGPTQPYGYGVPNNYAQPQYPQQAAPYPQQPPQYAQQPYGYGQPQPYGGSPYGEPGGNAQGYAGQPYAQENGEPQAGDGAGGEQPQALDPNQLEQLLAPVAIYPDALLAQVLTAATYPGQVAQADAWLDGLEAQGSASPDQVVAGADAHTEWDPSIKALTAFPQVLDMLARNLQWTTALGNAYYNQPQDVMQTVQVLRQRAEDAGNLQSTPQEPLNYEDGYIQLQPADAQMAYVPQYDPWTVYGNPISPYPGFSLVGALGSFFGSGLGQNAISYGLGIALSAFGRTPWGFLAWGLNWLANAVLFNHSDYFTRSNSVADWGLPHGGPRAYYGRGDAGHFAGGYGGRGRYNGGAGYGGAGREHGSGFANAGREFYGQRGNEHFNPGYRGGSNAFNGSQPWGRGDYRRPEPQGGRMQSDAGRQDAYRNSFHAGGRAEYGNGSEQGFAARPGMAFGSSSRGFGSNRDYARGNGFGSGAFDGSGSYAKTQHSGGFHPFGLGGHSDGYRSERSSKSFFASNRAPRGFGRESFHAEKMPRMRMPKERSFGGGRSGGGHFGHSGGGHRSSGHHR